jgi:predicted dehydrogenase
LDRIGLFRPLLLLLEIVRQNYDRRKEGMSNIADVSRRDFLKTGLAAGALTGVGLGGFCFGYNAAIGLPVRVGVIGTGDEGSVLIGALKPEFVEVKAIADIRPYNQFRAFHGEIGVPVRPGLMSVYGWKTETAAKKHVKVYGPFQELLENAQQDGIEAIIIATPLHLHAKIAVAAMNQGLHVITEKLMAHDIGQCKEMARKADEKGLYLAIGHQRHYNIKYWQAQDWIKRGLLGELHSVRAQWHRNNLPPPKNNDSWKMPLPPGVKHEDLKVKLDEEIIKARKVLEQSYGKAAETALAKLAQLEAQVADAVLTEKSASGKQQVEALGYTGKVIKDASGKVVYTCAPLEELIRWRLWDRTSAGMMAELGSHQLDAASIFVSALYPEGAEHPHPLRVVAAANRPVFGPDRDIEDHVCCIIEFPMPEYKEEDKTTHRKKIEVQYASINGNGYLKYGELVYGTKGTIALEEETDLKLITGAGDDDEGETSVKVSGGSGPTLDTQSSGPVKKAAAGPESAPVSKGYAEELEHWAWCIRHPAKENHPRCTPKVAMADAIIALTTNLAVQTGQPLRFRKEWFDPTKDDTPEKDLGMNL